MLTGRTIIELTDVHTGEAEHLEDHNMITNALTKFFEPLGHMKLASNLFNDQSPYYENVLGGLLMFDGEIEERQDLLFAPPDVNLTGCAVYNKQNDTTGKKRGAFNTTESEVNLTDRYVKYVYDFATSQANGTIASICLSHKYGGYTTYGSEDAARLDSINPMISVFENMMHYVNRDYSGGYTGDRSTGNTAGQTKFIFAIDPSEDLVYYFKINSLKSISIVKRRAYLKTLSIFEQPYRNKALVEQFTLNDLPGGILNTSYFSYNFDNEAKALYIISQPNSNSIAAGAAFHVLKISFGDWAVTEYQMTNQANVPLYLASGSHYYSFVYRGFLYCRSYNSPYNLYKIELTDPANITKIAFGESTTLLPGYPVFALNGRIFYECGGNSSDTRYRCYVLNTQTNMLERMEAYYMVGGTSYIPTYTPFIGDDFYFYVSYNYNSSASFRIPGFYLATINNLSTPVTKTADKTMKVTYIIQEQ